MKCPVCGQDLRPGKKDPNYLLCYNCKKKYKAPKAAAAKEEAPAAPAAEEKPHKKQVKKESADVELEKADNQAYANIPPKEVRDKREAEMRKAYDEMLSAGDGKKKKKKDKAERKAELEARKAQEAAARKQEEYDDEEYDDDYDDYDDEDSVSKAPIIILGLAIVVVAAVIAYMLLFK